MDNIDKSFEHIGICPNCGTSFEIKSENNVITCPKCNSKFPHWIGVKQEDD